jgi:epoxyqueuosine reductase
MSPNKEMIKAEASRLGFSFIGFSKPGQTPHFSHFKEWARIESHMGLDFLTKKYVFDARNDPSILLENVLTVITVGIAYQPNNSAENCSQTKDKYGIIASYACLPDYHHLLREKAQELIGFINKIQNSKIRSRFFVDSGPVMEKDFAFASGLGWIGKNSLLISPHFGSYCLLGCLFLDIELPSDKPVTKDLCMNCEACIQACPTKAINQDKTINSNRCISFLTTLYKGEIDSLLSKKIGNRVFGCDVCQTACPLNAINRNKDLIQQISIKPIIDNKIDLISELLLDGREYLSKYSFTTLAKLPQDLFLRNIIIAIGNSDLKEFLIPLSRLLENQSSSIVHNAVKTAIASIKSGISKED